jgi:tetratricopeptide (TPR) repeat protein
MQFQSALTNIDKEDWETAYDDLDRIQAATPELIHNRALLCQKLEHYAEANKLWAQLLGQEKKPKRSAPAEVRAAYAVILKNIGDNYLKTDSAYEAEPFFKEALDLVPYDTEALEALTEIYEKQDRLAELLQYARLLLDQHPVNEDYFFMVVSTLIRLEKNDEIIALYTDWLQRFPAIRSTYGSLMAMVYINAAFAKRYNEPQKAAELLRLSGKAADESSIGRYLRGFYYDKAQNGAKAEKEYTRAENLAESHGEQYALAIAFYQDGYMDKAMRMFWKIAGCTCDYSSDLLFDMIIPFLAKAQDLNALRNLTTFALQAGRHPYDLANMLYVFDQPELAREMLAPLLKQPYDLENHFMHLLILNRLGERDEAIRTAETMIDQARRTGDDTSIAYFKDVLKQLRSRGQSRILLEEHLTP